MKFLTILEKNWATTKEGIAGLSSEKLESYGLPTSVVLELKKWASPQGKNKQLS